MDMKTYIEMHEAGPGVIDEKAEAFPLDFEFVQGPIRRYRTKCQKCGGKPEVAGPETMKCAGCGYASGDLADFREQILNPETADGTW